MGNVMLIYCVDLIGFTSVFLHLIAQSRIESDQLLTVEV